MSSTHHGILIHVVFSTKQRFKLLHKDWRDDLFAYMGGIATEHKSKLLRSGGVEDHVHLLMKIHPKFAISDTIKLIKGNSSRWINDNKKIAARFEWQRGYGAFSVSESMSNTVKRYIEIRRNITDNKASRMNTSRFSKSTISNMTVDTCLMTSMLDELVGYSESGGATTGG